MVRLDATAALRKHGVGVLEIRAVVANATRQTQQSSQFRDERPAKHK